MNVWVNAQIHNNSFDEYETLQTKYAKCNSDRNRFFDIDDVLMRGPTGKRYSTEQIHRTAERLMKDKNMAICRNTGIQVDDDISKHDNPPHVRYGHAAGTNNGTWRPNTTSQ